MSFSPIGLFALAFVFLMGNTPEGLANHGRETNAERLNVLLITADDLGYEAITYLGGKVLDVTPNLNRLAKQSMSFELGHVNVAICAPSRSVIATGLYGHNSGCFGFNKLSKPIPTMFGTFQKSGYVTGILGKVSHSTTDPNFKWDFEHDQRELGNGRSPQKYYGYCREFFEKSKQEKTPFYFMVNSHDPHRPFHNPAKPVKGAENPSRLFSPEEISVPSYLADLPGVRTEISHYYNSVRRFDDTVGKVLQALEESGLSDNTLVVLITDNGSAFPFGKANTYLASTRSPFLIRWPNVVAAGSVDRTHFVSEVDFFPTFMEATGIEAPEKLDGRSLVPLLKGQSQDRREFVFTQIDYTIGGPAKPMRCIQDKQYGYIFNAFSDGKFSYKNNNEGETMKAMEKAASSDEWIQHRVDMFRQRVPQEFYDLQSDPGCVNNLFDSPEHQSLIAKYQARLRQWMVDTNDHCINAFDVRENPAELAVAVENYPKLVKQPKPPKKKKSKNNKKKEGQRTEKIVEAALDEASRQNGSSAEQWKRNKATRKRRSELSKI